MKRRVFLALGVVTALAAQAAPLDGRFSTHMLQHLLLGDLGPVSIALGLDAAARRRLGHPLAALPAWAAALVAWHLTPLYDAALRHEALHALQHATFFLTGLALWGSVIGGPRWFTPGRKLPYVGAMWLVSMGLSQLLLWSGHSYYARYSLNDQRIGGGVMFAEGSVVMLGAIVWLLLLLLREPSATLD